MEKCDSYHKAPFHCIYGERCQFMHSQREHVESHTQLLAENVFQFSCRTSNIEDPELSIFNVARPDTKRLKVFECIYSPVIEKKRHNSRRGNRRAKATK